jgi:hypothetical protein
MFWSYNIVKTNDGYGLYEVYYDDDWKRPFMRTQEPIYLADTIDEVKNAIQMMYNDCQRNPIIKDEDIKEENDSGS